MSEQQGDSIRGEVGSIGAGPAAGQADAHIAAEITSPGIAPDQEETVPGDDVMPAAPNVEAAKIEAAKVEAAKAEAPKVELPRIEAAKPEAPRFPGKMMIMAPADHGWDEPDDETESKVEEATGRRRLVLAAVVALATVAGAVGGALATAGYGQFAGGDETMAARNSALEATVARLDADMLALKASVEHTSKTGISQFNKTSDRLDKIEKAQAEPTARIAKLSEAVDKLRATPPAAVTPAASRDITGSVTPPATTAAATPAQAALAKPEIGRLPTVEGWVLRDVANGGALIEGRRGLYEVYAGDPIPGLGRVDAIRKQDGRWVVVTSKGLIVSR